MKRYGKYVFRWIVTLTVIVVLVFLAAVVCPRLYHIYMTMSGKQRPDVPSEARYGVRGVDVSYYQGNVDWDILASQGVDFAFIKATEGVDHLDPQFQSNWQGAAESSVYVGAYHFYRFEDSGAHQAAHFIASVPAVEHMLPPVIDVELYDTTGEMPDMADTKENLQEMLDALEAYYGVKPILYAAPNTYRKYVGSFGETYPIWISNYYYEPYFDWTFWQYTDSGELDGYDGDQKCIDLNVYHGTMEEFLTEFQLEGQKGR